MYLGRIVERGSVDEVLKSPQHPYTRALLSAVPVIDPAARREIIRLQGRSAVAGQPAGGLSFSSALPAGDARVRAALSAAHATQPRRMRCIAISHHGRDVT